MMNRTSRRNRHVENNQELNTLRADYSSKLVGGDPTHPGLSDAVSDERWQRECGPAKAPDSAPAHGAPLGHEGLETRTLNLHGSNERHAERSRWIQEDGGGRTGCRSREAPAPPRAPPALRLRGSSGSEGNRRRMMEAKRRAARLCAPPSLYHTHPPRMDGGASGQHHLHLHLQHLPHRRLPPLPPAEQGPYIWGSSNNKHRCVRGTEREMERESGAGPRVISSSGLSPDFIPGGQMRKSAETPEAVAGEAVEHLWSSVQDVLRPLSSVHCPLSSVHCPLSTVLCPLSSVHCPLSSVQKLLRCFCLKPNTNNYCVKSAHLREAPPPPHHLLAQLRFTVEHQEEEADVLLLQTRPVSRGTFRDVSAEKF
ncbi:unnamed protein product [Pleuronectes platessa]|uniref:Uncharacterized protein n=1 Tax=Pleuronectes platessa TaxID=8262 RepID=A0A9N7W3Q5_PLEPL|nr:unnamed protein product [Pleuronectes platessa]